MNVKSKIILALDVKDLKSAKVFIDKLAGHIKIFKVGPALFTALGPKIIDLIHRKKADVFLDLKFHDIPNTVALAVRQSVRLKVKMLTMHICAGKEMVQKAVEAAREEANLLKVKKPILLGITVLTSDQGSKDTKKIVLERARLAKVLGLDGIVCSVHEAKDVRRACGKNFIIVTPGIRPAAANSDDQKRVATAKKALADGADFLVVGRPILEAKDPVKAVQGIIK